MLVVDQLAMPDSVARMCDYFDFVGHASADFENCSPISSMPVDFYADEPLIIF